MQDVMLTYLVVSLIAATASSRPAPLINPSHIANNFNIFHGTVFKSKIQSNNTNKFGNSILSNKLWKRAARCHRGRFVNTLGQCRPCSICVYPSEILSPCLQTSDTICSRFDVTTKPIQTLLHTFEDTRTIQTLLHNFKDTRTIGLSLSGGEIDKDVVTDVVVTSHSPTTLSRKKKNLKRCRNRKSALKKCEKRDKSCLRKRRKRCRKRRVSQTTLKHTYRFARCPAGSFVDEHNTCRSCTVCSNHYVETSPCSKLSDTVCALSLKALANISTIPYQDNVSELFIPDEQATSLPQIPINSSDEASHIDTFQGNGTFQQSNSVNKETISNTTGRQRTIEPTKPIVEIPKTGETVTLESYPDFHTDIEEPMIITRLKRLKRAARCGGGRFINDNGICKPCTICTYPSIMLVPCQAHKDRVCSTEKYPEIERLTVSDQNVNTEITIGHKRTLPTRTTNGIDHTLSAATDCTEQNGSNRRCSDKGSGTKVTITSEYQTSVREEKVQDPETEMMKVVYIGMMVLIIIILLYIVIALLLKFSNGIGLLCKKKKSSAESPGEVVGVSITPPITRRPCSTEDLNFGSSFTLSSSFTAAYNEIVFSQPLRSVSRLIYPSTDIISVSQISGAVEV